MVNPQKKRMIMPDIMLDTRNVMIPVIRPVPVKQSFNVKLSENRPQILRAQNYKNNPALLFFETPSHALYNPLRNLLEVKRLNAMKFKNQSTKYTISGKADSASMKRISISQDTCPSKKSDKRNDRTLCFPNTMPMHLKTLINDKDLYRSSSRSIELSRKCNLPQMKHNQTNGQSNEDKFTIMPEIQAQVSNDMSESSIVSLPSQSFYDTTDTASTISALSVSSFRIENKEAFANTRTREKSVSRKISNQLQSINSECEIKVLHYENDAPSENCITHLAYHIKSFKTNSSTNNSSSTNIQDNNNNVTDEKNRMESSYKWDANKIPNIKYSWEVDSWVPFSLRKEYNDTHGIKDIGVYNKKPHECKIKYSWQVIGISTQTSRSLLQDLLDNTDVNKSAYKMCSIKYSWQIIGIGTQASLHDCHNPDYWNGVLLLPNKNYDKNNSPIDNIETDYIKLRDHIKRPEGRLRRYLILNNQETQTFAEKEIQTDANNAKYSWHDLIKQYV